MKLSDIVRGLGEDIETIKKARRTGSLRRECEYAKKHGSYKEKILACGISKLLSKKKSKRKTKRRYNKRRR